MVHLQWSEKLQQQLDFCVPYTQLGRWNYQSPSFHCWNEKHEDGIACLRNGQSVSLEPHAAEESSLICSLILTIYSLMLNHASNSMDLSLLHALHVLQSII